MQDLNYFKHIELIEGESALSLTLKLKELSITFQLNKVWSDGKRHYAIINAKRPLTSVELNKLSKIK